MCILKRFGGMILPVAMLLAAVPVAAQLPGISRLPGLGKDKDKAEKEREKQVERASKEAKTYEKLKKFSLDLYESDLDFREDVDRRYAEIRKQHSEEAFGRNVAQPARPTIVHDGDRLRLQKGLYDNKLVQDYVNRVGQQLVPEDSDLLYAFRLVAHPVPFAETMSTGTIYVSTGLISLLDNEAQLAYVLAHEMAHIHMEHWRLKAMLDAGEDEYNKKQESRRKWFALAGAAIGGGVGAAIGGSDAVAGGLLVGAAGGYLASHIFVRAMNLEWDKVQEDEADKMAFEAALRRNYDVQEVPRMYATLQGATLRDQRVGLGFMGNPRRVQERIANSKDLIDGPFKEDLSAKLQSGSLVGTNPDFAMVMSELKRDNGVLAFYYDMFQLAKDNLEYAVSIRSNDPACRYYLGKVLKLVGRSQEDVKRADEEFQAAIRHDTRNRFYGAHFYRALHLMSMKDPSRNDEIVRSLQAYLNGHQTYTAHERTTDLLLPANVDDMYEYLSQSGEVNWKPSLPMGLPLHAFASPDFEGGQPGESSVAQTGLLTGSARGAIVGSMVAGKDGAVAGAVVGGRIAENPPTNLKAPSAGAVDGALIGGGVAGVKGAVVGSAVGVKVAKKPESSPSKQE